MKVVAFAYTAAGALQFIPEKSTNLRAITSPIADLLISQDPNLTPALLGTPGATAIRYDIIAYSSAGTNLNGLQVRLLAGQTYFVYGSGPGTGFLYLD